MKKVLLLMLSASLMLASCSKSGEEPKSEKPKETCLVKTVELINSAGEHGSWTYIYDDRNRVIKTTDLFDNNYQTFSYQSNKIVVEGSPHGGSLTHNLDASGRISSAAGKTYIYNNEGYLIETKSKDGNNSSTQKLTYSNGNLVTVESTSIFNGKTTTISTHLEYNSDPFVSLSGEANLYYGSLNLVAFMTLTPYFGKAPKNMVSKTTFKQGNSPNQVTTYTYMKDANGKITSIKYASENYSGEVKLTYECK